jgi:hypothetical protein
MGISRSWNHGNPNLVVQHQTQIHSEVRILVHKQHRRIRSNYPGSIKALRTFSKVSSYQNWLLGHLGPHREKLQSQRTRVAKILAVSPQNWGFFPRNHDKPIPRSKNSEVNELAKVAAQGSTLPSVVFYAVISQPSVEVNIKAPKVINAIHNEDWRAPIMAYLKGYHELEQKKKKSGCSREREGTKSSTTSYIKLV